MVSATDSRIRIAGEQLVALPERALYWPAERMLFVADLHLGKASSFRTKGIPVPGGASLDTLERLTKAIERIHAHHVCILGDLWHDKASRTPELMIAFQEWRDRSDLRSIKLVEGNHDSRAGSLPSELAIDTVEAGETMGPFVLSHFPDASERGYVLCGHVHPSVRLQGRARESMTLACFWFGESVGMLPAFGGFTGRHIVEPKKDDRVIVVDRDMQFTQATTW